MSRALQLLPAARDYLRLRRSQYWPAEKLRAYAAVRLEQSLAAASRIPFYGERFPRSPRPDRLDELPILARREVSELERSVLSLHPGATSFARGRTSGSTGMPAPFLFDASHQRSRFAARARYLVDNGWSPLRRTAWIIHVRPESPDDALVRDHRLLRNHFFPHVSDFEEQAAWLERLDPHTLYSYPANLQGLLPIFRSGRRRLPSLRRVMTGSEVLDDVVRERVRDVFGLAIADNYGSTEAFLAWECPAGRYHINAEHVHLEIVDESGSAVAPGSAGRVLVTTLENRLMPLVRYEIGDWAIAAEGECSCGRSLPLIGRIIGRGINLFVDPRGKLLVPWNLLHVLKEQSVLEQYQIVQRRTDEFLVRYVAARPLSSDEEKQIQSGFERLLAAPVAISCERMTSIPRAPSGKFMPAISEVAQV